MVLVCNTKRSSHERRFFSLLLGTLRSTTQQLDDATFRTKEIPNGFPCLDVARLEKSVKKHEPLGKHKKPLGISFIK